MSADDTGYEFADIRAFFLSRAWFAAGLADRNGPLLTGVQYEQLKGRTLTLDARRAEVLRAFIDGYRRAKG